MKYLELGEVFKINIDNKMIYLKTEIDTSIILCKNCYFNGNQQYCGKFACNQMDREDNVSIVYKQINPIQDIFVVFGQKRDGTVKQCGAYPNEEDAKKKVGELNRYYFDYAHYYRTIQYYPYGIINDIKEVKIN